MVWEVIIRNPDCKKKKKSEKELNGMESYKSAKQEARVGDT